MHNLCVNWKIFRLKTFYLYIGRLFLYHTTNRTWSPSMFDETSHFISATPLTKTLSTLSSAQWWRHVVEGLREKKNERKREKLLNIWSPASVREYEHTIWISQNVCSFAPATNITVSHFHDLCISSFRLHTQIWIFSHSQIKSGNVFSSFSSRLCCRNNYRITQIFSRCCAVASILICLFQD